MSSAGCGSLMIGSVRFYFGKNYSEGKNMNLSTLMSPRTAAWGACCLFAMYGGAVAALPQTSETQEGYYATPAQAEGSATARSAAGPGGGGVAGLRTPSQSQERFPAGRFGGGGGGPMGGVEPFLGSIPPVWFDGQNHAVEQTLIRSLEELSQSSGEKKKELKDSITAKLQQQFDVMLVKREESLVQLEERVKKLRSELEKQKEQKDSVIDAILVLAENSVSARGAVQSLLRGWQGNAYGTFFNNAVPGVWAPYETQNRFPEDYRSLPARIAPQGGGGDDATEQLRGRLLPNEANGGGGGFGGAGGGFTGGGGGGFRLNSDAKGSDR